MAERSRRALLVVLGLGVGLGVLGFGVGLGRPVTAQDGGVTVDGEPCTDGTGVTVVIDFHELGDDTVLVRCAPDAPQDGFEALEQAGIPYRTTVAFPGFLCRIADRPDDDPCATTSPAEAYWSYWLAPAGGEWCYSNKGAGNRTPPPGAVEGWSFSLGTTAEDVPPPRHAAPGDPEGATPLAPDDCTTPASSSSSSSEPEPAGDAVGRGDPVDLDEAAGDGGSPAGTIAGVAAVAAVVVATLLVARRRRQPAPALDEDPPVDDAIWSRPP